jgi:LuxR family maltose regulon positive regulatory protein
MPRVPAQPLSSTDSRSSRSSDLIGSAGRSDNDVGKAAARAVLLATKLLEEVDTLVRGYADAGIASTLLASGERNAGVAVTSRNEGCAVGEELTPKELEVLRLLPTRLSRSEIGARLYVSLNTVKTHQRAVYRKLRVEHRSAAVSRARELGLL